MPTPRNDSAASNSTNPATASVEKTMIGATRCGSRCERMIRQSLPPVISAASTNSFSRSESTLARMMRAGKNQPNVQKSHERHHALAEQPPKVTPSRRPPTVLASAITNSRAGNAIVISVRRETTVSTQPR